MENLLQGIPHVVVRVDNILVSGKDDPDQIANLEMILSRLSTAGLKLKLEKFSFMRPEVTYYGYVFMHCPTCDSQSGYHQGLGMLNYTIGSYLMLQLFYI